MIKIILPIFILSACSTLTIEQQHSIAMKNHKYIPDQQQYGVEEVWTPSLRGDCEDYALWMQQRVGGELIYVRTEQGEPHIVLNVNGKIVDNMSKVVYPYREMKHKEVFKLSEGENGLPSFLKKYPVPKK